MPQRRQKSAKSPHQGRYTRLSQIIIFEEDGVTEGRNYRDLREHIELLDNKGLLITIDEPIDKDSEMHPLVRWQFRGGIAERDL